MSVALRDPIPENWDISDIGIENGSRNPERRNGSESP